MAIGVDPIPKKPSDHVQIVRFEMQEKEREMIESALLTWQFAKAGNTASQMVEAFDKLLSLENAYLLVTMYEMYTGEEILPGTPNDIWKLIDAVKSWWDNRSIDKDSGSVWSYESLRDRGRKAREEDGTFGLFDWYGLLWEAAQDTGGLND